MSECKFRAADGECLRERVFPYKEYCVDGPCTYYTSMTNADCIRAMTDEELAQFLFRKMQDIYQRETFFQRDMLDWLKQEVDNDET